MFFRKSKKVKLDDIGNVVYGGDFWSGDIKIGNKEFYITIEGTKEAPDLDAVENAKSILKNFEMKITLAEQYLMKQDLSKVTDDIGSLEFESVFVSASVGEYELGFGLSDDDWYVGVIFKKDSPVEMSLVH